MTPTELAKSILIQIQYMTLATANTAGVPWSSPVYTAFDDEFTFYWISGYAARHSQNIRENSQVAFVIYDSTVPEGTGKGVYIQAIARELSEQDAIAHALACIARRAGEDSSPASLVGGRSPIRVYEARPQAAWITSADNGEGIRVDTRLPINLRKERAEKGGVL